MACRIAAAVAAVLVLASSASFAAEATALPSSLPLRRDAVEAPARGGWWPSLALVTLAGAGGAWTLWRRKLRRGASPARGSGERHAVRVSSQALTAQASVHVVRWNGEELLVGCTAQQLHVLARRPALVPSGDAQS